MDLSSPSVIVSMLPWMLLFGWVARRLLDTRRLSLRAVLLTSAAGYVGGLLFAAAVTGATGGSAFLLAGTVFSLVFIMVAIVGLELLAARPRAPVLSVVAAPRVPHPVRAVRRGVQQAARLAEVSRIAARHGLGTALGARPRTAPDAGTGAGWPVRLRAALEEAGGMFVKLGQLLSTRVDLIPLSAARELAKLQESTEPSDPAAVRVVVERELGRPVEEVFAEFDWRPLAAASLGQVHAARLATGEAVAVKVQRPGIAEVVERDLGIVRRLARTAEVRAAWGEAYGVVAVADEFAARLREELDYRTEAENAVAVARALRGLPAVHVHRVLRELSSSRLLVMERLAGASVGSLVGDPTVSPEVRSELAKILLRAVLEPMLAGQPFHADPHPGNVFLLPNGRLGLLDFGATARLDSFERSSVAGMLTALQASDPTMLRDAVLDVAQTRGPVDVDRLDRALARFIAHDIGDGSTPDAEALSRLLQIFGAEGIVLPASTATMFRTLVTLEGTLGALAPGYRVVEEAQGLGVKLLGERLREGSLRQTASLELRTLLPLLHRAPRHLEQLATLAERGQLRVQVSLLSRPEDVTVLTGLVNRAALALLATALGGTSAALLGIDAGPALSPTVAMLDVLGYAGLAGGAILLLRVLLASLRA